MLDTPMILIASGGLGSCFDALAVNKALCDAEGVRIDEDGLNAVIRLAKGDMRKVLNVLQSAFMAYDKIGEAEVCKTTGNPLPKDVQRVMHTITNDDIATAFATVSQVQLESGVALADLIVLITPFISRMALPSHIKIHLYKELADLQYRLSFGTSEKIQLGSFIGIWRAAAEMAVASSTSISDAASTSVQVKDMELA